MFEILSSDFDLTARAESSRGLPVNKSGWLAVEGTQVGCRGNSSSLLVGALEAVLESDTAAHALPVRDRAQPATCFVDVSKNLAMEMCGEEARCLLNMFGSWKVESGFTSGKKAVTIQIVAEDSTVVVRTRPRSK